MTFGLAVNRCFPWAYAPSYVLAQFAGATAAAAATWGLYGDQARSIPDRDWRQLAAYRHTDPELFFPVSASGPSLDQITRAKSICTRCPSADNAWSSRWTPGRTTACGEA